MEEASPNPGGGDPASMLNPDLARIPRGPWEPGVFSNFRHSLGCTIVLLCLFFAHISVASSATHTYIPSDGFYVDFGIAGNNKATDNQRL